MKMMKNFTLFPCMLALTTIRVHASSNFNNGGPSNNSPYLYSEIQSLDFDITHEASDDVPSDSPISDESRRNPLSTEASNDHQRTQYECRFSTYDSSSGGDTEDFEEKEVSPTIVASSLLYDDECIVSSEAMMCNGGGGDNIMDQFVRFDDFFADDEIETSDEDDDDDNDGHSSMLSNASILRSKSIRRKRIRRHSGGSKSSSTHRSRHTDKVLRLNNASSMQSWSPKQQGRQYKQLYCMFSKRQRAESFAFIRHRSPSF